MRKKVVAMMMAAALVVSTAACGSSGSSKSESNTGSQAVATSEVANKDKPLVWFNRQPSNSSTGELDKTALNFNKDTYQYIKPARLVKFTQGICFDLTDKEKKTIGTILGIGDELFKPVQVYKSPKSSEPKL